MARAANGKMYVATANPGKIYAGAGSRSRGNFESQTFDARIFSRWGRLTWWGENSRGAGSLDNVCSRRKYLRSGEQLEPVVRAVSRSQGRRSTGPAARFVQWKAVLRGGQGSRAGNFLGRSGLPA